MPAKALINKIRIIDKIKTVKIIFDKLRNITEKNFISFKVPYLTSGKIRGIKITRLVRKAMATDPKIFER